MKDGYRKNGLNMLFLDIETSPLVSYTWGRWEQNVIDVKEHSYLLSFAWKWNDGPVKVATIKGKDDKSLVLAVWALLDEADVVVAHNGDAFDLPKITARFSYYKLSPPAPYKTIDTKKIAKRYFAFDSNSADNLGEFLGVGRKMHHEGFPLWLKCMARDEVALKKMAAYNKQDVVLLHKIYQRLLPYAKSHTNISVENSCPKCGSSHIQSRGTERTAHSEYPRFQCQDCGGWGRGVKRIPVKALVSL